MVLKPSTAAYLDLVRKEIDTGRLSAADAAIDLTILRKSRLAHAMLRGLVMQGAGALPGFFAFAQGERDGQALRIGVHINAMPVGMAAATGTPLALGLRQLLDGRFDMTGAHPPEAVVDAQPFFDGLARACNPPLADMGELVVVTETPVPSI